jgi:hypothetical protein
MPRILDVHRFVVLASGTGLIGSPMLPAMRAEEHGTREEVDAAAEQVTLVRRRADLGRPLVRKVLVPAEDLGLLPAGRRLVVAPLVSKPLFSAPALDDGTRRCSWRGSQILGPWRADPPTAIPRRGSGRSSRLATGHVADGELGVLAAEGEPFRTAGPLGGCLEGRAGTALHVRPRASVLAGCLEPRVHDLSAPFPRAPRLDLGPDVLAWEVKAALDPSRLGARMSPTAPLESLQVDATGEDSAFAQDRALARLLFAPVLTAVAVETDQTDLPIGGPCGGSRRVEGRSGPTCEHQDERGARGYGAAISGRAAIRLPPTSVTYLRRRSFTIKATTSPIA